MYTATHPDEWCWHSTIESALGLTHPCEVTKVLISHGVGYRWQVDCENCGPIGWRGEGGFRSPEIAERFAHLHEERNDMTTEMPDS